MRDLFNLTGLFDTAHDPFQHVFLGSPSSQGEIWEKDGTTYIELPMPGVRPEDVDAQTQDNVVSITWKRKIRGTEEKTYRNYRIAKDVDIESIQAKVENGLLTIELRKAPKAQARKIPVLGANPAPAVREME